MADRYPLIVDSTNENIKELPSGDSLLFLDNEKIKVGTGSDLTLYHDASNSYITNAVGALKVATETSGIAVTIGHTTSETTVADNLTVTGNMSIGGNFDVTGWFGGIGLLFLVLCFIIPSILRPVYRLWMLLAYFIGGIDSRVILTVLFYLVLTPTGLALRLFRKDVLNQKFNKRQASYWIKKDLTDHTQDQYSKMY